MKMKLVKPSTKLATWQILKLVNENGQCIKWTYIKIRSSNGQMVLLWNNTTQQRKKDYAIKMMIEHPAGKWASTIYESTYF